VRTCEVDFHNRLKASALFDLMQEAASNNAVQLGFGYDDMRERNQFWVLSRAMLRVHSAPGFGEEIIVETWPKGVEKLFALRDFIFYDSAMARIGEATTAWLIVNAGTLRPTSPESIRHGVTFLDNHPRSMNSQARLSPVAKHLSRSKDAWRIRTST